MNSSLISMEKPTNFFQRQKLLFFIVLLVFCLITIGSSLVTNFKIMDVFTATPKVIVWVLKNMIPDTNALSRLPDILDKLIDTIFMSIMSSVTAAVFAFIFALLGSNTTKPNNIISAISRGFASINRNIPIAAWAMIFLLGFGQSSFTGFLALFFASFGFLTRVFTETIDEASISSVQALRATGANFPQLIAQAIIPSSLPQLISWILYVVELNIRSATLVGLLTGSGIGFTFSIYYKSLQYKSAALVTICIVAVVLVIESISNNIRRKIL